MTDHQPRSGARHRYGRLAVLPLLAALALAVGACGGSSSSGGSGSSGGSSSSGGSGGSGNSLTVATSADFPPMSFRSPTNANQVIGFEVDMLKSVMKNMGSSYKLVTADFNGLIPSVQSGRTDIVVSDVYDTPEREKVVDFVDYLRNSFAVMVAGDTASKVHSFMDLCGKSLGVLTGSAPELDAAKKASAACTKAGKPAITIRSYPQVAQELPQLTNGHLDALYEEYTSLAYIAKKSGGKYAVAFPDVSSSTNVGMVVKKGSQLEPKLREAVRKYLASPQYKADAAKWGIQGSSLLKPSALPKG